MDWENFKSTEDVMIRTLSPYYFTMTFYSARSLYFRLERWVKFVSYKWWYHPKSVSGFMKAPCCMDWWNVNVYIPVFHNVLVCSASWTRPLCFVGIRVDTFNRVELVRRHFRFSRTILLMKCPAISGNLPPTSIM